MSKSHVLKVFLIGACALSLPLLAVVSLAWGQPPGGTVQRAPADVSGGVPPRLQPPDAARSGDDLGLLEDAVTGDLSGLEADPSDDVADSSQRERETPQASEETVDALLREMATVLDGSPSESSELADSQRVAGDERALISVEAVPAPTGASVPPANAVERSGAASGDNAGAGAMVAVVGDEGQAVAQPLDSSGDAGAATAAPRGDASDAAAVGGSVSGGGAPGAPAVRVEPGYNAQDPRRAPERGGYNNLTPLRPGGPIVVPQPSERLRFSFRFQPWRDVIEWFADRAGLSLELETAPTGTFNYIDDREYTPEQALNLLNSVLITKGYILVRRERMLMLINLDDIPANFVTTIPLEELPQRDEYELTRVLFQLNHVSPEEVAAEIADMVGPLGKVAIFTKARQVLVTEMAGQLRAIQQVIERMEEPERLTGGELHLVELEHVLADEVLPILRQLLRIANDANATADGSFRLAIDTTGKKFWLTGEPPMIVRAKEIIAAVDVADPSKTTDLLDVPQLEVYPIELADPASVLAVMQTLLVGTPDVRLSLDPKTNALVALGRPADHATIRATLEQMEGGTTRGVDVIGLTETDPLTAKAIIEKFFGIDGTTPKPDAPLVEADILARRLIVRGSASEVAQIRSLLAKTGEVGFGQGSASSNAMIRTIPLSGASADVLLQQIQQVWPTLRPNPIRVVTPSAMIPSLRSSELAPSAPAAELGPVLEDLFGPGASLLPRPMLPPDRRPSVAPPEVEVPSSGMPRPVEDKSAAVEIGVGDSRVRSAEIRWVSDQNLVPMEVVPPAAPLPVRPSQALPTPLAGDNGKDMSPIVVSSGPGGLMIASQDTAALDQFESIVRMLADSGMLTGSNLTVYYLKHATATVVATTLQDLMGSGASTATTSASLLGGGLLDALLTSGGIQATGPIKITAEPRLNALLVQANATDQRTIEILLPILDQLDSPEDIAIRSRPRPIQLVYCRAEEVLSIVREVYADRMQGAAAGRGGGGERGGDQMPSPQDIMAMIRGQQPGGQAGGRQGGNTRAEEAQKMTLSVDAKTNTLIVSAPELLFLEVEAFVRELDQMAQHKPQATEVYIMQHANRQVLQQALGVLAGDAVQFGAGTAARRTTPTGGTSQPATGGGTNAAMQQMQQRMDAFRGMQGGGGAPAAGFGGRGGR